MLNLNKLFHSSVANGVFYDKIEPTTTQQTVLEGARNKIREHLKVDIRNATINVLGLEKMVRPRFRTQGSWLYKTCVQQAWVPPQEMDLDFGVYLPVSVWENGGPPRVMAKAYFELVERSLLRLCKAEGWVLVGDHDKCIRVRVATWGHIDIPLYAVPEKEFEAIRERALLANQVRKAINDSVAAMDSAAELEEQEWADFDKIVLATRAGEWKPSDSEKVYTWFRDRVAEHNDQLRRVCMYLKAWRDYQWKNGDGPTSVAIMVAVAQAFECFHGRDDLALLHAANTLATALSGDIHEDGIDDGAEDFNRRLNADQRCDASTKARALAAALKNARELRVGSESAAILMVCQHLGDRVPVRLDLVEGDSGDSVRQVPARTVPPPFVRTTKAG